MTIRICDRCGAITVDAEGCICTTPYSLSEVRRRHRAAVESAPRRTAAAALPGERAQARVTRGGAAEDRIDAAPPAPHTD